MARHHEPDSIISAELSAPKETDSSGLALATGYQQTRYPSICFVRTERGRGGRSGLDSLDGSGGERRVGSDAGRIPGGLDFSHRPIFTDRDADSGRLSGWHSTIPTRQQVTPMDLRRFSGVDEPAPAGSAMTGWTAGATVARTTDSDVRARVPAMRNQGGSMSSSPIRIRRIATTAVA